MNTRKLKLDRDMSALGMAFVIFLTLKLTVHADLPWLVVFAPIWFPLAATIVVLGVLALISTVRWVIGR